MKLKFLALLALLTSLVASAQVTQTITATSAGTTNSVLTAPGRLYSVTYTGTGNVWVYDSTGALTFVTPAYTNASAYVTNLVSSVTNYYGYVYSQTNTARVVVNSTIAQTTNSYPIAFAAGMTSTAADDSFIPPRYMNNGITVRTTNAATVTVVYSR